MKVTAAHRYAQNAETVFAAFSDPGFYQAKFEGVGARKVRVVSHSRKGGRFRIETERDMRVDVPGVLKTFLGEWNTIRQTEEWEEAEGEFFNELELDSAGVPVSITGSMVLRPEGDGCVNDIEMEIQSHVPLVGKKLAEFVAGNTERGLEDEYRFITEYLRSQGNRKGEQKRQGGKKSKRSRS